MEQPPGQGVCRTTGRSPGITTITSGTYGGFGYNYANVPTGALSGQGAINGQAAAAS